MPLGEGINYFPVLNTPNELSYIDSIVNNPDKIFTSVTGTLPNASLLPEAQLNESIEFKTFSPNVDFSTIYDSNNITKKDEKTGSVEFTDDFLKNKNSVSIDSSSPLIKYGDDAFNTTIIPKSQYLRYKYGRGDSDEEMVRQAEQFARSVSLFTPSQPYVYEHVDPSLLIALSSYSDEYKKEQGVFGQYDYYAVSKLFNNLGWFSKTMRGTIKPFMLGLWSGFESAFAYALPGSWKDAVERDANYNFLVASTYTMGGSNFWQGLGSTSASIGLVGGMVAAMGAEMMLAGIPYAGPILALGLTSMHLKNLYDFLSEDSTQEYIKEHPYLVAGTVIGTAVLGGAISKLSRSFLNRATRFTRVSSIGVEKPAILSRSYVDKTLISVTDGINMGLKYPTNNSVAIRLASASMALGEGLMPSSFKSMWQLGKTAFNGFNKIETIEAIKNLNLALLTDLSATTMALSEASMNEFFRAQSIWEEQIIPKIHEKGEEYYLSLRENPAYLKSVDFANKYLSAQDFFTIYLTNKFMFEVFFSGFRGGLLGERAAISLKSLSGGTAEKKFLAQFTSKSLNGKSLWYRFSRQGVWNLIPSLAEGTVEGLQEVYQDDLEKAIKLHVQNSLEKLEMLDAEKVLDTAYDEFKNEPLIDSHAFWSGYLISLGMLGLGAGLKKIDKGLSKASETYKKFSEKYFGTGDKYDDQLLKTISNIYSLGAHVHSVSTAQRIGQFTDNALDESVYKHMASVMGSISNMDKESRLHLKLAFLNLIDSVSEMSDADFNAAIDKATQDEKAFFGTTREEVINNAKAAIHLINNLSELHDRFMKDLFGSNWEKKYKKAKNLILKNTDSEDFKKLIADMNQLQEKIKNEKDEDKKNELLKEMQKLNIKFNNLILGNTTVSSKDINEKNLRAIKYISMVGYANNLFTNAVVFGKLVLNDVKVSAVNETLIEEMAKEIKENFFKGTDTTGLSEQLFDRLVDGLKDIHNLDEESKRYAVSIAQSDKELDKLIESEEYLERTINDLKNKLKNLKLDYEEYNALIQELEKLLEDQKKLMEYIKKKRKLISENQDKRLWLEITFKDKDHYIRTNQRAKQLYKKISEKIDELNEKISKRERNFEKEIEDVLEQLRRLNKEREEIFNKISDTLSERFMNTVILGHIFKIKNKIDEFVKKQAYKDDDLRNVIESLSNDFTELVMNMNGIPANNKQALSSVIKDMMRLSLEMNFINYYHNLNNITKEFSRVVKNAGEIREDDIVSLSKLVYESKIMQDLSKSVMARAGVVLDDINIPEFYKKIINRQSPHKIKITDEETGVETEQVIKSLEYINDFIEFLANKGFVVDYGNIFNLFINRPFNFLRGGIDGVIFYKYEKEGDKYRLTPMNIVDIFQEDPNLAQEILDKVNSYGSFAYDKIDKFDLSLPKDERHNILLTMLDEKLRKISLVTLKHWLSLQQEQLRQKGSKVDDKTNLLLVKSYINMAMGIPITEQDLEDSEDIKEILEELTSLITC